MSKNLPKRNEVPQRDTWKLEDIFATDALFSETLAAIKEEIPPFKSYEGNLLRSGNVLFEFLKAQDHLAQEVNKLYVYSHMRLHQDGQNALYQDFANQTELLSVQLSEALAFVQPELSGLTPDKLQALYEEAPALSLYTRYLQEILRQKVHILDSKTESLLAKVSELADAPHNIFAMFNNVDLSFPLIQNDQGEEVRLTHGTYIQFLESRNLEVRKGAFNALYETYAHYKNMLATTFAANVKQYGLFSSVRGFETPLHYALSANNIPTKVYENLITTVNQNLDLLQDYMALRKNLLEVDTLHMYDLFTPIVKNFELKITYEEACEIILKALAPLGEDYVAVVRQGFSERWVDKYENEGKRSGAYSWGCHGIPHPYILMNYVDNLSNLFTLAHEMGHAMHSYYSHKEQPFIYSDYCIFVAEVASTVNEALLMQYLLKTVTDPLYKEYLLNYFMELFKSTLYRQTMFSEFERDVHLMNQEGKTLNSQLLCSHYLSLVKKYHGEGVNVDTLIENEWARIPHFYTPFYVYQYATGYSAAIALSTRILEEGEPAVKDYLQFLKGGSSKDPIDLLKDAGVDMSTPLPIEKALHTFKKVIEEMKF